MGQKPAMKTWKQLTVLFAPLLAILVIGLIDPDMILFIFMFGVMIPIGYAWVAGIAKNPGRKW
jgi:hypothetical protein